MKSRLKLLVPLIAVFAFASGCGKSAPTLHPITGEVTLKGKKYDRLIIHFRPMSGPVTTSNMAIAETDKDGKFPVARCADGAGLPEGEYRVVFSCMQMKSGKTVGSNEKPDDDKSISGTVKELVPPPYDLPSEADTPVRFTVKPGDNVFTFDIPTSK